MTELPINFFKNQIILKYQDEYSKIVEEIFPHVFRTTINKKEFTVEDFIEIFRHDLHSSKITCFLCPVEIIQTMQDVFDTYFSQMKPSKLRISQRMLQNVTTAEEQNDIIEHTHDRAHRGIEENYNTIVQKYFFY